MSERHDRRGLATACADARAWIHRQLDGDPAARPGSPAARHLECCSDCREFRDDLRSIQSGLRGLPELSMPRALLDRVRNETLGSASAGRRRVRAAGPLAAAAMLAVALLGLWRVAEQSASPPTAVEVARAAEQTRLVLDLMAAALNEAERSTGRVLQEKLSPALEKVPVVGGAAARNDRRPDRS